LADGNTKGVFQLEGHLGKTWASKVKPANMEELAALVALIRPGCLRAMSKPCVQFVRGITLDFNDEHGELTGASRVILDQEKYELISHKSNRRGGTVLQFAEGFVTVDDDDLILFPAKSMTQHYKDRKHRLEDVEYLAPALEPILNTTYGVLTYQEQSMRIAVDLAGFNLQQADVLRKAIGKKKADIMAKVRGDFYTGCTASAIVSKAQAEEIFGWIQESQRYSFNKSHAISYGEGGYWTAYLKAHFPTQFYCSYIHGAQWKADVGEEVYELVNDAKLGDVPINVPNFSDQRDDPYIRDNIVYFGLSDVKQIGKAALVKMKDNVSKAEVVSGVAVANWKWLDYLLLFSKSISSTVNNAIISCGGLDYLKKSRTSMMYELSLWQKLTKKEREWIVAAHADKPFPNFLSALRSCARVKKEGGGCHNVKRVKLVSDLGDMLQHPPHALHDTLDFIAWSEENFLGAALTCSKVDGCERSLEATVTCRDILNGHSGYAVLAVEVIRVKEIKTRKGKNPGQKMAFLTLADSSCALDDIVIFPEQWRRHSDLFHEGNTILVRGEKGPKKNNSFIIQKVWQI
jgi:DNA polymerase-3 subunit alpha